MHQIIEKHPNISNDVTREAGIVKFPKPTMQVFKAHGAFEYSVSDYNVIDVPLATVKAWARRITESPGRRNDKDMVAEAIEIYYGETFDYRTRSGKLVDDISDAIAVGTVYLVKNDIIDNYEKETIK